MEGSVCEQINTDPDPGGPDTEHCGNFGLAQNIWFGRNPRGGGRGRGDHQDCSAGQKSGHSQECQLILRFFVLFSIFKKIIKVNIAQLNLKLEGYR
jgi:hypothetical protein